MFLYSKTERVNCTCIQDYYFTDTKFMTWKGESPGFFDQLKIRSQI